MSIRSQFPRRVFLNWVGPALGGLTLSSALPRAFAHPSTPAPGQGGKKNADSVLRQLLEGNGRFAGGRAIHPGRTPEDFRRLASGQSPIAVILSCADSRVPPEIVFDQGLGDLFVVRVAGNYVTGAGASVHGSIEYGVAELGAPLVMVLGHSQCGAVKAAIKSVEAHHPLPGAIDELVNRIKPAVLAAQGRPGNPLDNAIRANVSRSVEALKVMQPILAPRVRKGEIKVVGATYELSTGKVTMI
jgi:carbonic anhydrase